MGKERVTKEEKKKERNGCCEKEGVRRGAWSYEDDKILVDFITLNGCHGTWRNLPKLAGLLRCGKSCRLRWTNYLRPDIKRGPFTLDEENTIIHLQRTLGNKWAAIASHLPGRTDNDIKNFFNTRLRKRLGCKSLHQTSSPSTKSVDVTKSESPPSVSKSDSHDFFPLFQNTNESTNKMDGAISHSPSSETLSFAKYEMEAAVRSESSKSDKMDDESDAMMKVLLDFPLGADDMEFL